MKNGNKKNTAAMLYVFSSIIWFVVAIVNIVNSQFVYAVVEILLAGVCLFFAKRKRGEN